MSDEGQARKVLTRLLAQVDGQRNARTKATLSAALDAWLRVHQAEDSTLEGYRGYIRRCIKPELGDETAARRSSRAAESNRHSTPARSSRRCRAATRRP